MRKFKKKTLNSNSFFMLALGIFCITVCLTYLSPGYSMMLENDDEISNNFIDSNYVGETKTINPNWVAFNKASEEEKLKYNLIPDVYLEDEDVIDLQSSYDQINNAYGVTVNDSYYNLKNNNLTLPNRNQSSSGLCWAFAALSSVEGSMLKSGLHTYSNPIRMSPRQMDYASTVGSNITEGINPYESTYRTTLYSSGAYTSTPYGLLDSGVSPVVEDGSLWAWNNNTNKRSLNETINVDNVDYYVTGYARYGSVTANLSRTSSDSFVKKIKNHIINYGEIAIGTIGPSSVYGGSCVYIDGNGNVLINKLGTCNSSAGDNNSGHSMVIIGWDDNYSYSYCRTSNSTSSNLSGCSNVVTGKGAWILKNSWGNSTPYPYLAYTSQIDFTYGITSVEVKNWDVNYDSVKKRTFTQPALKTYEVTYKKDSSTQILRKITWKSSYLNETFDVYVKDGNGVYNVVKKSVVHSDAGLHSLSVNGMYLTSDTFSIKIVSNQGSVEDINAFTSYSTSSTSLSLNTVVSPEIMNYSTSFSIYTTARNLDVGAKISYSVIGDNGADYSGLISFSNLYNINGLINSSVSISGGINTTGLTLYTYYNGVLYDTDYIKVISENGLWEAGTGTSEDPFIIYNAEDFKKILQDEIYMSSHFKLANDIDFSGISYDPTVAPAAFRGTLDGDGHAIYNLVVSSSVSGLFKEVHGGKIKNLNLNDCIFNSNNGSYSGAIAATSSYGYFTNIIIGPGCKFNGTYDYVGGVVGFGVEVILQNVVNYADIDNKNNATLSYTGGVIGYATGSYFKQVFNYGDLNSVASISGGIAGRVELSESADYNIFLYIYNHGDVTSSSYHGGLVGLDTSSRIDYAYTLTTKSTAVENFGHLVGGSVGGDYYYTYYPSSENYPVYASDGNCSIYRSYALSLDDFKNQSSYNYFDFEDVWVMKNNYPIFKTFEVKMITSISADNITVNKNKTKVIEYSVLPVDAAFKKVDFISSNNNIAEVTSSGVVKGVKEGNTTIKLTATDGSEKYKVINVKVENISLDFGNLSVDDKNDYILNISPNTKVSNVVNQISTSGSVVVKNKNGIVITDNSLITTGSTINISVSGNVYSYVVIVVGDTTGIGSVKMSSVMKIADYLFDPNVIKEDYYKKAADVTGDGKITMSDVMKLANSLF